MLFNLCSEVHNVNQNCRSLQTKLSTFNCNVSALNYIFISLTETWLTEKFSNSKLGLFNYNIFRFDRCITTSNFTHGGGVLIGNHQDIVSFSAPMLQPNDE